MTRPKPQRHAVDLTAGGVTGQALIGDDLLENLATLAAGALGAIPRSALLVLDTGVPESLTDAAHRSLETAGASVSTIRVTPSELNKSLETFGMILQAAAHARLDRRDPVIAVGGGIVCDLAGFSAACYRRGVPMIQCPTTLLAMVDASVGGKTGVNLPGPSGGLRKNMAGAFHQPSLVLADTRSLASLDGRHLRAGLAECVKHAMIAGSFGMQGLASQLDGVVPDVLARDRHASADLIARHVALKATVVARDERETTPDGGRALLNLGHTFAHAIETIEHLSPTDDPTQAPLQHGEAVALGLVCAARYSAVAGIGPRSLEDQLRERLARIGLPTSILRLPSGELLLERMLDDKKVAGGAIRLIAPVEGERAVVTVAEDPGAIALAWDAIRA